MEDFVASNQLNFLNEERALKPSIAAEGKAT
jgi:hypothetical protein